MLRRWAASRRWWRPPTATVDTTVVVAVAVVVGIAITVARESRSVAPDGLAYALAGVLGLLTLGRRRRPLAVLLCSAAVLVVYYSLQYPGISPALALAVALYAAAAAGRTGWAAGVVAFFLCVGVFVRLVGEKEMLLPLLVDTVEKTSLMVVVVLLGATVRARRLRGEAAARELAAVAAERDREAASQIVEERLRIARELHDVLAHTIAAVTVQAGVALDVLGDAPDDARVALREIRTASRAAADELRGTVGVLRDGEHGRVPPAPAPTLDQLEGLATVTRRAGVQVTMDRTGTRRALPPAVELTAYRIVQESLTNVVRHAAATSAAVAVHFRPDGLVVEITDDGAGARAASGAGESGGHGIRGMRERAVALGGTLQAGPRVDGGFSVLADLPVDRPAP